MIALMYAKPGCGKSSMNAFLVQTNKKKKLKWEKKTSKSKLYKKLDEHNDNLLCAIFKRLLFPIRHYDVIYSTDETINDTVYVPYENVGLFRPTWNSLFLFEECGIGFDSRNFKNLPKHAKRFFAMHRHCGVDIFAVSQTADVDKALRCRAEVIFLGSKLGQFTLLRKVIFQIDVDEQTHEIVEGYYKIAPLVYIWQLLTCKLPWHKKAKIPFTRSLWFYRKPYYKHFDSFVDDYDYPLPDPAMLAMEPEDITEEEMRDLFPEVDTTRSYIEKGLL